MSASNRAKELGAKNLKEQLQQPGDIKMYVIGQKIWFKGDEVTITTKPYKLYGGEFQDAITESGKVVCVVPPAQDAINTENRRNEWRAQQAGFRRLKILQAA